MQLKERGWKISYSDDRWKNLLGGLRQKMLYTLELPSIKMISHWSKADIVIITTRISLVLAIIAKLLGKKVVFLDAMCEEVPRRLWRRIVIKYALKIADKCICLSSSQAKHWASKLGLDESTFTPIFYGVDTDFYKPSLKELNKPVKPYALSVGRDPQRDFVTLVNAISELDWELILVTQHYLVPDRVRKNKNVKILDGLSYEALFDIYNNASVVVIPVKKGVTYMSGIRATMEAMLLKSPVAASRTSGMEDYFVDEEDLIFYTPEETDSLVLAFNKIMQDNQLKMKLINHSHSKVCNQYSVSNYADSLENILSKLI